MRETIQRTHLKSLIIDVEKNMRAVFDDLEYVNMSVDGWADNTNRCFNGYIAQSIDRNWFAYRKSYITAKHIHIYFHNLKLINKHIR